MYSVAAIIQPVLRENNTKRLEDKTENIKINGKMLNNIRYADNAVLIASNETELHSLLDSVIHKSKEMRLKLNVHKTKTMVIS